MNSASDRNTGKLTGCRRLATVLSVVWVLASTGMAVSEYLRVPQQNEYSTDFPYYSPFFSVTKHPSIVAFHHRVGEIRFPPNFTLAEMAGIFEEQLKRQEKSRPKDSDSPMSILALKPHEIRTEKSDLKRGPVYYLTRFDWQKFAVIAFVPPVTIFAILTLGVSAVLWVVDGFRRTN